VDDDPAVLSALRFSFETQGFDVDAFYSAEQALCAPNAGAWRCMVLDLNLPGMTGLDLLDRLRADGVTAPAILITTNPSKATKARAGRAGAEIIEKPLLDDALASRVATLVSAAP
jgi:two-component system response regulator FixJ